MWPFNKLDSSIANQNKKIRLIKVIVLYEPILDAYKVTLEAENGRIWHRVANSIHEVLRIQNAQDII